jgi:hypothetical protein
MTEALMAKAKKQTSRGRKQGSGSRRGRAGLRSPLSGEKEWHVARRREEGSQEGRDGPEAGHAGARSLVHVRAAPEFRVLRYFEFLVPM